MLSRLKALFSRKYLGIDISDNRVTVLDLNNGVVVEDSLTSILSEVGDDFSNSQPDIWTNRNILYKIIDFCVSKSSKGNFASDVILSVPVELRGEYVDLFLKEAKSKVKNVESLHVTENVIAAAIGASSKENQIIGPNAKNQKKLYIFSQTHQTYFSLIWAGGLVKYRKINKGYGNLCLADFEREINGLVQSLPIEPPQQFRENFEMAPFIHLWEENIGKVYISIPTEKRVTLGEDLGGYKVIYTRHDNLLVLRGLEEILKAIL